MKEIDVKDIQIGTSYLLTGDIENGWSNGAPLITKESVVRVVTRIANDKIDCVCGRKFLVNDNLKIFKVNH